MMNTKLLLTSFMCSLCFTAAAHANTQTNQDSQTQKHQQVCKGKKQGDMVSYAQKGVVFNGVCQNNAAGKLTFQPPTPSTDTPPETQSHLSETQSAPRPVTQIIEAAPLQAPMAPPADVEPTAP